MKAEGRRQKAEGRSGEPRNWNLIFFLLLSAFCLLPSSVLANDLLVDPKTLQLNDLTTITVSLEGNFASVDSVNIPLDNLALVGEPWVSSEFAWINGEVVRRKVFRYRARPLLAGAAHVGPIVLTSSDGKRDTLPLVNLQVEPDRIAASNDPEAVLRELMATGRPPLFMVAEADKRDAWMGEQVIVTWYLYNAATVENWQIVSVPKLAEFWSEELESRSSEAERVYVGNQLMQRVRMRRVALYPLRGGALEIGSMSVEAAVMERLRGPFSIFEGNLVETTFSSAPISINVKPLPPGPPVDAVGELLLSCAPVTQRNGGPVVVEATVTGSGNLRGASPPRFARAVAGNVQVENGETGVVHEEGNVTMTRKWRFLIFPSQSGTLTIPAMTMNVFTPSAATRNTLRCEEQTLVNAAAAPDGGGGVGRASGAPSEARRRRAPLVACLAFIAVAAIAIVVFPRAKKELALRREVPEIMRSGDVRTRIDARLGEEPSALLTAQTDRGDAYRSLRSLLDAMDRDRDLGIDANKELVRRVRELLR